MTSLTFLASLFSVLLFFASIWAIHAHRRHGGLPYPPGPRPLPILGNLLDVPKDFSWLAYTRLSKTYGAGTSLLSKNAPSDSNARGYSFIPYFWEDHRCLELH